MLWIFLSKLLISLDEKWGNKYCPDTNPGRLHYSVWKDIPRDGLQTQNGRHCRNTFTYYQHIVYCLPSQ